MKANNLTICIDAYCNKNCPYCISKMTWSPTSNLTLFASNLSKARKMAELASVNSVLITSKGEPLNNMSLVETCLLWFTDFPLEIQTNGNLLSSDMLQHLRKFKLNTLAISIDKYEDIAKFKDIYHEANKLGINIRLTIVLTSLWQMFDVKQFLAECYKLGVKQLTFRKVTIPDKVKGYEASKVIEWIKKHEGTYEYPDSDSEENESTQQEDFLYEITSMYNENNLIRVLSFGSNVHSLCSMSITVIDYCIQESHNENDIRSLIYHQDGHMYTAWDKPSSILF